MASSSPLLPNPFKNPPASKTGNFVARDIFAEVGYALSTWEHCETAFASLYTAFVKPTGGNVIAMRAYGAVASNQSRSAMLEFASEAYFAVFPNDDLLKRTTRLRKLYLSASDRRAEIAHGVVMGEPNSHPPVFFLIPSYHASRKQELPPLGKSKYKYGSKDIAALSANFDHLHTAASDLQRDVRAFYESLPEKHRQQFP